MLTGIRISVKIQSQVCLGIFVKPQRCDAQVLGQGAKGKSAGTSTPPLENPVLSIPGFSHPQDAVIAQLI